MIIDDSQQKKIDIPRMLSLYKNYQKFVQLELPLISIKINKNSYSEDAMKVEPPSDDSGSFIIWLDYLASRLHTQDFKALAFHEFTHIWDLSNYLVELKYKERQATLKPFTEIHGYKTQLKSAFGFNLYNDAVNVCFEDKLGLINKIINLGEYINQMQVNVTDLIDVIGSQNDTDISQKVSLVNQTYYYIGCLKFCELYCKNDINKYLDFSFFSPVLEFYFSEIYSIYPNNDCPDEPTIYKLKLLQDKIVEEL